MNSRLKAEDVSEMGKIAAAISIVSTAYFVTAAVGAHVVMTQYDVFSDDISDYAVGPQGWIDGSAFVASAIGCLALAVALVLLIPSQALSGIGVVLLILVGATYVSDFAFPTDILPPGASPTTEVGAIHLLAALLGWLLFVVSSLLMSSGFRRDCQSASKIGSDALLVMCITRRRKRELAGD